MSASAPQSAQQSNDLLLGHILEELRATNAAIRESNRLQVETAARVAVMHSRTAAIFGIEGGDGGSFGKLKKIVARHEKYFNAMWGVIITIPVLGGIIQWILDHVPGVKK